MDTNEPEVTEEVEATEEVEEVIEDSDDPAVLKARIKKLEEKARAQRERTKIVKQQLKKTEDKKGELDNADFALLAVKGYENEEDIEFIQDKMQKWNKSLREILRDQDVIDKLKGMKIERDVKSAMPSATKRSSAGQLDNLDYWITKHEQTGELPDNFELRSAVINAKMNKSNPTLPPWRR